MRSARPIIWLLCVSQLFCTPTLLGKGGLDPSLARIETRLTEESSIDVSDPNSLTFLRATGVKPARQISAKSTDVHRTLTLSNCLKLSFENNNDVKQAREHIIAMGGSKLIANSRFLPTIEIINQYEHVRSFESGNAQDDSLSVSAAFRQRLLEYGKDNPIDVSLRAEQREALFGYENTVTYAFSQVRRAFYFVLLKDRQIATRRLLFVQFQHQYERKKQRMEAGNLSVKIEVLTARLNVLNEQTRINTLERQKFNRKMDLLRLIGLSVGADAVEFKGQEDTFGLEGFDLEGMIGLALSQSSDVALGEALVAEQKRVFGQLRYEYLPDLRGTAGYQDKNGRVGLDLSNESDTWGLDLFGQPGIAEDSNPDGLGLFNSESAFEGSDGGWFAGLQLRIPVSEGRSREGRRIQNRAYLRGLRAALDDRKDRIELRVRQNHKFLNEEVFQVELAQENVSIERERFSIQEQLRDAGKIDDDALERFRENFFQAQDGLFSQQEELIQRQEDLRLAIRFFK